MIEICPICGYPTTWEEVDIGVGIQYSPAWCDNCGWREEDEIKEVMERFGILKEDEP